MNFSFNKANLTLNFDLVLINLIVCFLDLFLRDYLTHGYHKISFKQNWTTTLVHLDFNGWIQLKNRIYEEIR